MKIVSCALIFINKIVKMKFNYKLLVLVPFLLLLVGCPKDDTTSIEIRPFAEVYAEDLAEIETFMQTHTMSVDADYNVTVTEITATNPGTPIKDRSDLQFKTITQNDINYKLYYIKLREGVGENPTRLDSVYSSYKGFKSDLTVFDAASNPVWFQLGDVIQGWQEIFPEFKTGTFVANADGTVTYNNFGAGIVFIPSALAYYSSSIGNIGTYTPLIFSFKLMRQRYKDHDGDKIYSKDEYGSVPTNSSTPIDTDGDGLPDYKDYDDDNDGKLTKREIQIPNSSPTSWYSFTNIPICPTDNKKVHLTSNCIVN